MAQSGIKDKRVQIGNAAIPARNFQQTSGAVPRGGSKVVTSVRKDGKVWYRQLQALAERARTAKTPAESAIYSAAYNRGMVSEAKKQGKSVAEFQAAITVQNPLVGVIADEQMGFGSSIYTQTVASKQRRFANTQSTFGTMLSRDDVRGPEPRRKIDASGIQSGVNLRTYLRPNGTAPLSHIQRVTGK